MSWAMMVPVMVTTVEIVRFRLSAAPMKRTRRVLLRSRPATLPQAQQLRCRLVHVDDARKVELVHVRIQQLGVRRLLDPA